MVIKDKNKTPSLRGFIIGEMFDKDGNLVKNHFEECTEEIQNLIVKQNTILWASILRGDNLSNIPMYFCAGTGVVKENQDDVILGNEIARVVAQRQYNLTYPGVYKDPNDVTRSNVVDIKGEFGAGVATGAITELGLMWGKGVTAQANTGDLINRKVFPVWNKTDDMTVVWTWRLEVVYDQI